jgi:hypothetical protein
MLHVPRDHEYIVPGVLSRSRSRITADAFNSRDCPFTSTYVYDSGLPDGALDTVVVRIARSMTHVEYSANAAVFNKLGHTCQLLCSVDTGKKCRLNLRCGGKGSGGRVDKMRAFERGRG